MKVKVFYPFTLLRKSFNNLQDVEDSLRKLEPFYYFKKYEKGDGLYCFEAMILDSFVKNIYLEIKNNVVVRMVLDFDLSLFDKDDLEILYERIRGMVREKDYNLSFENGKVECVYKHVVEEFTFEKAFDVLSAIEKQTVEILKEKGLYNIQEGGFR